jgi:hypothetical protein
MGRTVIPRVPPPLQRASADEVERERLAALREMYARDEIDGNELARMVEQALRGEQPTHADGRPAGRTSPFARIAVTGEMK